MIADNLISEMIRQIEENKINKNDLINNLKEIKEEMNEHRNCFEKLT